MNGLGQPNLNDNNYRRNQVVPMPQQDIETVNSIHTGVGRHGGVNAIEKAEFCDNERQEKCLYITMRTGEILIYPLSAALITGIYDLGLVGTGYATGFCCCWIGICTRCIAEQNRDEGFRRGGARDIVRAAVDIDRANNACVTGTKYLFWSSAGAVVLPVDVLITLCSVGAKIVNEQISPNRDFRINFDSICDSIGTIGTWIKNRFNDVDTDHAQEDTYIERRATYLGVN